MLWTLFVALVWSFLWFWPWQLALQDFLWLRLGIALMIFLIPGLSVYGLLSHGQGHGTDHLTFGFVISHLIFAAAGMLGRLVHVSFDLIKDIVMALGLILLIFYFLSIPLKGSSVRIDRAAAKRAASLLPLILVAVLSSLIVMQRILSDDDLTYLAYLTNWQHSSHLDFKDLLFGTDQVVQPRFWLVSTPFAQAFLAEISGQPGILILGGYYEPFLVVISMLCWYGLARTLNLSHQAASIAVILQILFLLLLSQYLHPGASFFNQLSVDKTTASFIFVPVFIQGLIRLLREPARDNVILFLAIGLSLTLMHPIALAYAVFIGSFIILLNMNRSNLRIRLIPMLILIAVLMPQIALRLVHADTGENLLDDPQRIQSQYGYENMLTVWHNTPFYGFSPNILAMTLPYASGIPLPASLLKWGWLLLPVGAVVFSVPQLRQSFLAQYIFSSFLLCAFAGFPLTGWLLGYFLSPWVLERTTWLFPYGLSAVFFLFSIRDKTVPGQNINTWLLKLERNTAFSGWPLIAITLFSAALILLFMRERQLPDLTSFESRSQRYQNLAMVGQFLDNKIPVQAVVLGSDELNDSIPGLSSKAKIITFRTSSPANMPFFSLDAIKQRIADRKTILSRSGSPEVRLNLLKKYNVRFLLLRRSDYDLFRNLVANHPAFFEITEIGRYIVVEVR